MALCRRNNTHSSHLEWGATAHPPFIFVTEPTRIGGHRLKLTVPALRTGDSGLQLHGGIVVTASLVYTHGFVSIDTSQTLYAGNAMFQLDAGSMTPYPA